MSNIYLFTVIFHSGELFDLLNRHSLDHQNGMRKPFNEYISIKHKSICANERRIIHKHAFSLEG